MNHDYGERWWGHGSWCSYATRWWINKDKNVQFMEDWNEPNFEQVPNQKLLPIQKTFAPTEQTSNPLSTGIELIQPV